MHQIQHFLIAHQIYLRGSAAVVGSMIDDHQLRMLAGIRHALEHIRIKQPGPGHAAAAAAGQPYGPIRLEHGAQVQPLRRQRGIGGGVIILIIAFMLLQDAVAGAGIIHIDEHALGDGIAHEFNQRPGIRRQRARRIGIQPGKGHHPGQRKMPPMQHFHAAFEKDANHMLPFLRAADAQKLIQRRFHGRAAIHADPQMGEGLDAV